MWTVKEKGRQEICEENQYGGTKKKSIKRETNMKFEKIKDMRRKEYKLQGGSNMTGTKCDLFTHNQSRSYLNHLVNKSGHK